MFCPECGIEERQALQFCRACGTDIRRVRLAVDSPESVSGASAREEIGRAIAEKIRGSRSAEELAVVAEEVLPEVEKFLESAEEKRMRRLRSGMIIACVGVGTAVGISIVSMFMNDQDVIFLAALGIVTFFIGIAFILNGLFLTVPRKSLGNRQREDEAIEGLGGDTNDLRLSEPASLFSSVTEHTTRHLKEKEAVPRD